MKLHHFIIAPLAAITICLTSCSESSDSEPALVTSSSVVGTETGDSKKTTTTTTEEKTSIHASFNTLLQKYALPAGVKYKQWKASAEDGEALNTYLVEMGKVAASTLPDQESKAFYINLYNAAMIQAALDAYPTKSVAKSLPFYGIFKKKFIALEGETVSLDHVEKGLLLKKWPDARIHFAVNCASYSCPPLRAEAFEGSKLETQLDEQTKLFANSEEGAQVVDGKPMVSSLLDWYASDFPGDDPVAYLNQFRDDKLPQQKPGFIEYNWDLNEAK